MANKLYEEASVQAIADAIRFKRDESTETYTISEMDDGVLNFPFSNIPSYHYAEAGRVVKRILDLKASYPNHIVFGTISDNHVNTSDTNAMSSARHGTFALEYVGALAQCDFIANLGDNCEGTNIDVEADYINSVYIENCTRYALTSQVGYSLVGNHDKSNSTQKLFDLMGKFNTFDNYGTTKIRGFGYKDYTDKKVRVICLNTCDYWNTQGGNGMSYEQKDFLMKALDLSSKSNYSSWTIIILSHIPLDFLGGDYNKGADLKAILKAYNNGTTASITVNSSYASAQNENGKYSGTLTYNYSGKNAPKVINIHGHIHTNKYGKLKFIDDNTELDIVRVATPNSSFNGNASTDRYTSYGDYSITTTEANKIKKVANSKADTSATFYFFDLDSQTIHAIGYGADIDRTVIYKSVPTYKVTYSLKNCESSNKSTAVAEGSAYTSTITPITDATIDSVVVTMGGTDITSSAYKNDTITISEVTGDIVITAVASIPLWEETVSNIAVAVRSVWQVTNSVPSLVNSNAEAAIGVTTANSYSYMDRENKTIYLMPVNAKACDVTVTNTDNVSCTYCYIGLKENNGTFTTVFSTNKIDANKHAWNAGTINYILISMERKDGSSWAWGYDDTKVKVTFTNGGTGTGGNTGGDSGNTPTYTNVIDTVGTVDNVRLRSSGATAEASGFASNYFEAKAGDVIRVYFPNGNRVSIPSNGVYFCGYSDTNGTLVAAYGTGQSQITDETDKGYTVKVPSSLTGMKYARVAGGANGQYAGWIVTVNEEITD